MAIFAGLHHENAIVLLLSAIIMQLTVATDLQTIRQAQHVNITYSAPSCNDIDFSTHTAEHYSISIIRTSQVLQSMRENTLYFTSNMVINIFYHNHTQICIKTDVCQLDVRGQQANIQLVIEIAENVTDMKQPLIFCLSHTFQRLLKPLKKNNEYLYRSSALSLQRSLLSGSFYLLKPYSQSLKLHIQIEEGYPLIVPYICPVYDLEKCVQQLTDKISQTNRELASSFYLLLFKIGLFRYETINIDFCSLCYWVIYMDCKIGYCSTRFGFDHSGSINYEGSLNLSRNQDIISPSLILKQGRFHSVRSLNYAKLTDYSYTTHTQSQMVYYPALPYESVFIDCNHHSQTYRIKLNQSQTLAFIVRKDMESKRKNSFTSISCRIRVECLVCTGQVYYSNLLLRRAQMHKKYPIKVTRSHPAIFHYQLKQSRIFINIKKCSQAPITLTYYFIPDYEAIRTRVQVEGQESKQLEDWVTKKQIRIIDNYFIKQIMKPRQPYMTNNIMIEILPDTYSYIQLAVHKEKFMQDKKIKVTKNISLYSQEYIQDDRNTNQVQFVLKMNVSKSQNNETQQQSAPKIMVIQSQNPDHIQRIIQCPQIKFIQAFDFNKEGANQLSQLKIITHKAQGYAMMQISGKSQMKYLSISIQTQNQINYTVLQLKSKINPLKKYAWLLGLSGATVLLMLIGAILLLLTRARKR